MGVVEEVSPPKKIPTANRAKNKMIETGMV